MKWATLWASGTAPIRTRSCMPGSARVKFRRDLTLNDLALIDAYGSAEDGAPEALHSKPSVHQPAPKSHPPATKHVAAVDHVFTQIGKSQPAKTSKPTVVSHKQKPAPIAKRNRRESQAPQRKTPRRPTRSRSDSESTAPRPGQASIAGRDLDLAGKMSPQVPTLQPLPGMAIAPQQAALAKPARKRIKLLVTGG